jgi:hypothetical protein
MYWHVQGHEGFDFKFNCQLKVQRKEMVEQAMAICMLRHVIWEVLQQNPEVVNIVGKMSQGSSFAAEDITSYFLGIKIAYEMTQALGEEISKGMPFVKAREKGLSKMLEALEFIDPHDPIVQKKYYDIVDVLAKEIVVDPTKPALWLKLDKEPMVPAPLKSDILYELIESCDILFPNAWILGKP